MNKVRSFHDLRVWRKAHQLVIVIYRATEKFPNSERFGLTSQIRRAAISTAATIVEGSSRKSTKDLCHFLNLSQGSNDEVRYLAMLSHDLGLFHISDKEKIVQETRQIGVMLHALITSLNTD